MKKKVKHRKSKVESSVFYVGLSDPIPLRRAILQSSKEIVQSLQQYDRFAVVRGQKKELIDSLKSDLKLLQRDLGKLKSALPSVKGLAPVSEPVKLPEKSPENVEEIDIQPQSEEMSELAMLEKELGEIETKLGHM